MKDPKKEILHILLVLIKEVIEIMKGFLALNLYFMYIPRLCAYFKGDNWGAASLGFS